MTDEYVRWKDWKDADFGSHGIEESRYYSKELSISGVTAVNGLRIAEVGYGNGAFAGWARKAGGRWIGREAIPELQLRAASARFEVVPLNSTFSAACGTATVDLFVAFDVIEHLDLAGIRSFLHDVRETLKPGGVLLMRFPSGDSPFSTAIYRGDLTHRTLLGSGAIRQLSLEAGLAIRQLRPPASPLLGLGAARACRRTLVLITQNLAFSFMRTFLMGKRDAVLSPNMLAVLRKPDLSESPQLSVGAS